MTRNPELFVEKLKKIYWLLDHIQPSLEEMKKLALDVGMFKLAHTIEEVDEGITEQLPDKIWLGIWLEGQKEEQ